VKKVLFISHEASHTGAPIVLLRLLRWIRKNTDLDFDVFLLKDGPLKNEFESLATVHVFRPWWKPGNTLSRATRRFVQECRQYLGHSDTNAILSDPQYGLIYVNAMASSELFGHASPPKCPVIAHIHEATTTAFVLSADKGWDQLRQCTARFIFPSDAARLGLGQVYPEIATRSMTIPGFIEELSLSNTARDQHRQRLGISKDAFVVGAVGFAHPVKGFDMLPRLATILRGKSPSKNVQFVWVGANPNAELTRWVFHDLTKLNLQDVVTIIPPVTSPQEYFNCFDVLVMLSREESFPLVMLEAGALGLPIVMFDQLPGPAEFIGTDAGIIVPYIDLEAMSEQIIRLANDSILRTKIGQAALAKVRDHYTAGVLAPKIYTEIQSLVSHSNTQNLRG